MGIYRSYLSNLMEAKNYSICANRWSMIHALLFPPFNLCGLYNLQTANQIHYANIWFKQTGKYLIYGTNLVYMCTSKQTQYVTDKSRIQKKYPVPFDMIRPGTPKIF